MFARGEFDQAARHYEEILAHDVLGEGISLAQAPTRKARGRPTIDVDQTRYLEVAPPCVMARITIASAITVTFGGC
jgi:hypothetical protein